MDNATTLVAFLDLAVPIAIQDLKARGGPTDDDFEEARAFGPVLAERGDVLQFGHLKQKDGPGPGDLFAQLARAIAVMAYVPGGVHLFGRRWEVK